MVDENETPDSTEALPRELSVNATLKIQGDKIEILDSPDLQKLTKRYGRRVRAMQSVTCSPVILNYEPC